MSVAFSTPDGDIITETVSVDQVEATPQSELRRRYHLDKCVAWITTNQYRTVALQFPDELLVDATPVSLLLEDDTKASIFILADTSYGSCCVDEVAAEHVAADCVIHFGHSCLSATSRLPVHLVFVDAPLDVSTVADDVCPTLESESTIIVFTDVRYQHALGALSAELARRLPASRLVPAEPVLPSLGNPAPAAESAGTCCLLNRQVALPTAELPSATLLHVGPEGSTLTALAVSAADSKLLSYNPAQPGRPPVEQGPATSRAIRRRYYLVERARDAGRVGILVGTLAVHRYPEMLTRLKRLLRSAGKRYYTLVCGKLNAAKLANFPELDVLALVSCPESALLESRGLLRPVVTPYEMELACRPDRTAAGRWVVEFCRLLPGGPDHQPLSETRAGEVTTDVSLVTGRLRTIGLDTESGEDAAGGALVPRGPLTVAVSGAAEALAERSWRGLEVRGGDTPVGPAIQGLRGVAAGYEGEGASKTEDADQGR